MSVSDYILEIENCELKIRIQLYKTKRIKIKINCKTKWIKIKIICN